MFLITSVVVVQAQEDAFRRANVLYEKEVYGEALTVYDSLINSGASSFGLWYNYAMTNLRLKKHGLAIYGFEKAKQFTSNEDLEYHLSLSQEMIADPIPEFSDFFLVRWWHALVLGVGPNFWAAGALIFFFSGLILLWFGWNGKLAFEHTTWVSGVLLTIGILALCLSIAGARIEQGRQPAIVMIEGAAIHEGSDERSPELRLVSEGIKIMLIDSIGDWYKVRLPDKDEGWIKSAAVRPL